MYATRSLSQSLHAATKGMLKIVNDLISEPPEGPFSGYLLLQEEEDSSGSSSCASCWGICKDKRVKGPPFPQNKCLHPLSSNLYYVVMVDGKHEGLVGTCSRHEDKAHCCCCRVVKDKKPSPFDPNNIYQHMQIIPKGRHCKQFVTKSAASDGHPGQSLHRKECVIVGEWCCPFIFIKEKGGLDEKKDQLGESMYYKMSLEQQWEGIHSWEGLLKEKDSTYQRHDDVNGFVWFETANENGAQGGLVEIRWDQHMKDNGVERKYEREFQCGPSGEWIFALYVLVERYVLNGSLIFTYTFRHSHQLREKWE
ncbi:hypothetical protein AMTRI_Chr10g7190 [Amborella trichopoda]